MDLAVPLGVDTDPVRHCSHSSEGPAGTAASLVSDLLDGRTVRPSLPGVETGWQILGVSQDLNRLREVKVSIREDSHQGAEVLVAGLRVETGDSWG